MNFPGKLYGLLLCFYLVHFIICSREVMLTSNLHDRRSWRQLVLEYVTEWKIKNELQTVISHFVPGSVGRS
jgi:hypothetical protein